MKKEELLKKLENIADDADVNEIITGLEEFANPSINRDVVEKWCQEGEGKSWLDRNCDIYSAKAIETARKNAIEKYEKEVLPTKIKESKEETLTPEQLEIKQLKEQMNKLTQEKEYNEKLKTNASKLKEKKLSTELAKYINTDEDITFFETLFNEEVQNAVQSKIKSNPPIPEKSQGTANVITKEQFNKMNYKERLNLYNENRDLYNTLSGDAQE